MTLKLPLTRYHFDDIIRLAVPDGDVAKLERAYALLLARCEAAEAVALDYGERSHLSEIIPDYFETIDPSWETWRSAKAAHEEVTR